MPRVRGGEERKRHGIFFASVALRVEKDGARKSDAIQGFDSFTFALTLTTPRVRAACGVTSGEGSRGTSSTTRIWERGKTRTPTWRHGAQYKNTSTAPTQHNRAVQARHGTAISTPENQAHRTK